MYTFSVNRGSKYVMNSSIYGCLTDKLIEVMIYKFCRSRAYSVTTLCTLPNKQLLTARDQADIDHRFHLKPLGLVVHHSMIPAQAFSHIRC